MAISGVALLPVRVAKELLKGRVRVAQKGGYELLKREGASYSKRRVRVTQKGGYELLKRKGTSY